MLIGKRLKKLRESKNLSQGDIQKVTGLTRPYISRVENGRSVPGVEILERWAGAFEMPLYELMHDGEKRLAPPQLWPVKKEMLWGDSESQAEELSLLRRALSKMNDRQRNLILAIAGRMATRSRGK